MAFGCWKIGLNIQDNGVYAVALLPTRQGWQARGWWEFSDTPESTNASLWAVPERLILLLKEWRRLLPRQHRLAVSFPALQTVQRLVPQPGMQLNEPQREAYMAMNLARELQLDAQSLRFDYRQLATESGGYAVTAIRQSMLQPVIDALHKLQLEPESIIPDACALQALLPSVNTYGYEAIVQQQANAWLWASAQGWGAWSCGELTGRAEACQALGLPEARVAFIEPLSGKEECQYDPWQIIPRRQPPLPENGGHYTVALALAIGGLL